MHGSTSHGKGSVSRVRDVKRYSDNFDQIKFKRKGKDEPIPEGSRVPHVRYRGIRADGRHGVRA